MYDYDDKVTKLLTFNVNFSDYLFAPPIPVFIIDKHCYLLPAFSALTPTMHKRRSIEQQGMLKNTKTKKRSKRINNFINFRIKPQTSKAPIAMAP